MTHSCLVWLLKDSFLSYWAASSASAVNKATRPPAQLNSSSQRQRPWVIIRLSKPHTSHTEYVNMCVTKLSRLSPLLRKNNWRGACEQGYQAAIWTSDDNGIIRTSTPNSFWLRVVPWNASAAFTAVWVRRLSSLLSCWIVRTCSALFSSLCDCI